MRTKPHHRAPDLLGKTFGRLTVTGYAGSDGRKSRWAVACACGTTKDVVGTELMKGKTLSCGCLQRERASAKMRTHGMARHPAYIAWRNMLVRCQKPWSQAWENYGGRGISVCERWQRFENFWADMGPMYRPGLTLDRLDNSAGYSPENCAWRTYKEQARNQRANRMIDTPQGPMLLCEAVDLTGINLTTLHYRWKAGWPAERMFDTPDLSRKVLG